MINPLHQSATTCALVVDSLPATSKRREYMYGTMDEFSWANSAVEFECHIGADL
jgi:hypothetical protein